MWLAPPIYSSEIKRSSSWRKITGIITRTGDNFLLSNSDIKNLELLSPMFPNYIGVLHKEARDSIKEDGSIVDQLDVNWATMGGNSKNNITGTIPTCVGNVVDS